MPWPLMMPLTKLVIGREIKVNTPLYKAVDMQMCDLRHALYTATTLFKITSTNGVLTSPVPPRIAAKPGQCKQPCTETELVTDIDCRWHKTNLTSFAMYIVCGVILWCTGDYCSSTLPTCMRIIIPGNIICVLSLLTCSINTFLIESLSQSVILWRTDAYYSSINANNTII